MSLPYDTPPLSELGLSIQAGKWDAVFEEAMKWLEVPDSGPIPFFVVNAVSLLRGDFAQAWKVYPKAFQEEADIQIVRDWIQYLQTQFPDESHVCLIVGLFLAQSGNSEQAIASYERAGQLDPKSAYPYFFLAQIHQRKGHMDRAIKSYREAIKRDPTYVAARINLGVAYQEQGQLEMAIPQYREVLKLRPNDPVGHCNLACALGEQGKLDLAIQEYKRPCRSNLRMPKCISLWVECMNKRVVKIWLNGNMKKRSASIRILRPQPHRSDGFCLTKDNLTMPWIISVKRSRLILMMPMPPLVWGGFTRKSGNLNSRSSIIRRLFPWRETLAVSSALSILWTEFLGDRRTRSPFSPYRYSAHWSVSSSCMGITHEDPANWGFATLRSPAPQRPALNKSPPGD